MTDSDLHEANRLAHEVARAALRCIRQTSEPGYVWAYIDLKEAAEKYEQAIEREES